MKSRTVGLATEDSRLYYIDLDFVVMDNPFDGGQPTLIMRSQGIPDERIVGGLLEKLGLEAIGEPYHRHDGLWCQEVKRRSVDVIM